MSLTQVESAVPVLDPAPMPPETMIRAQVATERGCKSREDVVVMVKIAGEAQNMWIIPAEVDDFRGWVRDSEIVAVVEVLYAPTPVVPAQRVGSAA
ncbi:hypothetical protein [Kineosporia sp. NBRC 101731]|uniref:hypothetical protein n=1 Tax=Kineosporia sp. NBRC 101731 TaxID=3032199 RepID=UPI0024A100FE|nr:hypothetical protein [Kineosporia sp. NBRC 101731]GLY31997.1 hypothetical protein Kisp02_53620 [Kineosporia sp. NBRC 101731]